MLIHPIHHLLDVYLYGRSHNIGYQLLLHYYEALFFQKNRARTSRYVVEFKIISIDGPNLGWLTICSIVINPVDISIWVHIAMEIQVKTCRLNSRKGVEFSETFVHVEPFYLQSDSFSVI